MSQVKVSSIVDTSGGNTVTINGYTPTLSNMAGRNRIINGGMVIDQRNAGASVTPATSTYTLDRWRVGVGVAAGSMSFQQVSDAPDGFVNSLKCTVVASATPAAGDLLYLHQNIEGFNVSDLNFGSSSAKTITVSFWVKSSVVGLKSVSINNRALDRAYCTTFSINVANVWEYKEVTIPGDTSGVWDTENTIGLELHFNFSIGSNYEASSNNSWESGRKYSTASTPDFISNAGATFYITGVQLEAGSVATPFEHRQYGTELALCQRYYYSAGVYQWLSRPTDADPNLKGTTRYGQTMRATPTITNTASATVGTDSITADYVTWTRGASGVAQVYTFTASAEL